MSRPVKSRKLTCPPRMNGFKPFGVSGKNREPVCLHFDEYEGFNLINYHGLGQEEAAEKMNISRPTFTRLYQSALVKISTAFMECRPIKILGGTVQFEKKWYKCKRCYKLIEGLDNHHPCMDCEYFGQNELIDLQEIK